MNSSTVAPQEPQRPGFWPLVPDRLDDLHVSKPLLMDLTLRHIRSQGTSSLQALSRSMRISIPVVESLYHQLRHQQYLDVEGMHGNDYSFRLTQKGRDRAGESSQLGQYAGPVPVSVEDYHRATRAQAAHPKVTRTILRDSFKDLVFSDSLLDQLGPSLISPPLPVPLRPTGNGKTSIAERLLRIYQDSVVVPYAIEVDGHIMTLFDPVVHRELDIRDEYLDPRWVVCQRPCITVGGELVSAMLELRLDQATGIYAAPLQMKANNGILIIDDFGRQVISPRELLNRWIVPLDRRVDYLTLSHGVKFQIPFEMLVVFSTNLEPSELADEAFLRRIHTKVYVEGVSAECFDEIFHRVAARAKVNCDVALTDHLRRLCLRHSRSGLRACYPGDIVEILTSICEYEDRSLQLTVVDLERAVDLYFTRSS